MIGPVVVLASCRFGQDTAGLMLWGAAGYLAVLVPDGLGAVLSARLTRPAVAAMALAIAATLVRLPAEAAVIGDGWRDAADPAMLGAVLRDTAVGRAWIASAFACLGLGGVALVPHRSRLPVAAATAGLLLASQTLTGHALMQDGWLGALHRLCDLTHVLSAGAWLGALVPVSMLLAMLGDARPGRDIVSALESFSRAGHVAVGLVLLTGAANVGLVLGRWPLPVGSPYEALLDAKIVCVAAMTALAVLNRYWIVPRLARRPEWAGSALRLGTLAEIPLGLAAVALVSVFGLLDPG